MQTASDPSVATGILAELDSDHVVLTIPHTDYRIHLQIEGDSDAITTTGLNKPISGRIEAQARRVDIVNTGGRFFEPTYGRPRRLQGRIIDLDTRNNTITVQCPIPFVCRLMPPQEAHAFEVGQLVSFDIERGAVFQPM